MKFTTTIPLVAFLCGFARAAPAPDLAIESRTDNNGCVAGDDWKICIIFDFYEECINGIVTDFSCSAPCEVVCPVPNQPCHGVCVNPVPCAELGCGARIEETP
ncbi:hypothetical protein F5Y06DRAFT_293556 [Hypoxylon sp. FL0890]|nr:hypothetical protein F5Y06DRAFT_293556 [Hypoxylon sp. FL0890]